MRRFFSTCIISFQLSVCGAFLCAFVDLHSEKHNFARMSFNDGR